ncbi:MAG: acyl-CoA/acyl-ACP dehydrogenase [Gammaproteobacteria bacterium]|nr:acyl-CoA/acyl-ACP dehydrogenase [Gammaproteobacteria bacterium]
MVDFTLSEEQLMLQKTARDFAQKEIKPIVEKLHHLGDDTDPWPLCKPMVQKGVELGFTKLFVPEEYGGIGATLFDTTLILEELGAADVSIAADYFSLTASMALLLMVGGNDEQKKRIFGQIDASDCFMFSGAQSEPNVAGSELFCPYPDAKFGMKTQAKREGDHYILNGQKSAFITNAGISDAYFILARTDSSKPQVEGVSIFYVPANAPGLQIAKRTKLIGWHTSYHAEVYLDNVKVPVTDRIGEEGGALMLFAQLPQMPVCLAACFIGLARASYEYALQYAKERNSWGQPIIEHQAVALKLADMYCDLQAARLMVWDAAKAVETNPFEAGTLKGPAAKTMAVDVAIKNAERAMQILGGYGVAKEYSTGRFLNDAWVGYACDFTRDVLRLGMVGFLK